MCAGQYALGFCVGFVCAVFDAAIERPLQRRHLVLGRLAAIPVADCGALVDLLYPGQASAESALLDL